MIRAPAAAALVIFLALALLPSPAGAQIGAPPAAVACISQESLWNFLDAEDVNDVVRVQQLLKGECRALESASYALVASHNGTAKILVFKRAGDWESAQTLYTLDEMLGPDREGRLEDAHRLS